MTAIIIVIACLVVAGLLGTLALAGLASGESGPKRFAVSEPTSASGLFTGAVWAATVSVEVAQPPGQVRKQVTDGRFVALSAVVRGPETRGAHRRHRGADRGGELDDRIHSRHRNRCGLNRDIHPAGGQVVRRAHRPHRLQRWYEYEYRVHPGGAAPVHRVSAAAVHCGLRPRIHGRSDQARILNGRRTDG